MAMWIDSTGSSYVDSIVFDNYFYATTPDAHWGNRAMELRNAWDYTLNQGIAGSATADTDTIYSAWGSFETIPIPIQNQPFNFSFFYKYFPVNGDTGVATLQLFDSSMNQIGESTFLIFGTVSTYTLATAPVVYTTAGTAAFAYVNFRTAVYGIIPGFGTRLLIDDVMFNYVTTTGIHEVGDSRTLRIFPNPANDELTIGISPEMVTVIEIMNTTGQLVRVTKNPKQIGISDLSPGIYFVKTTAKDGVYQQRFVKQ